MIDEGLGPHEGYDFFTSSSVSGCGSIIFKGHCKGADTMMIDHEGLGFSDGSDGFLLVGVHGIATDGGSGVCIVKCINVIIRGVGRTSLLVDSIGIAGAAMSAAATGGTMLLGLVVLLFLILIFAMTTTASGTATIPTATILTTGAMTLWRHYFRWDEDFIFEWDLAALTRGAVAAMTPAGGSTGAMGCASAPSFVVVAIAVVTVGGSTCILSLVGIGRDETVHAHSQIIFLFMRFFPLFFGDEAASTSEV
mmetsp:Transcript_25137/g.52971  ORF Transcript_25137/g.52971 Transcript_25137/m.52971 type:complete len:251 (+) Transcript_25137:1689-2441(+)